MKNVKSKIFNVTEISKNMDIYRKLGGLPYGFPKDKKIKSKL